MRIGEIAERAGVSPATLRGYERRGLIPAPERTAAGYRDYPPSVVERVSVVRQALAVGFKLAELASILAERGRGGRPCQRARSILLANLERVGEQRRALARLERQIRMLLADWDARLVGAPPDRPAQLLETLGEQGGSPALSQQLEPALRHHIERRRAARPRRRKDSP